MTTAYIGLGSNLNQPIRQLRQALQQLATINQCQLTAISSFFGSKAIGPGQQPDYVNAVARLETQLSASELLQQMQAIEAQMGRVRGPEQWQARTLDLDLLLYDQMISSDPFLTVPHPRMQQRNFVTRPLLEIAPELQLPNGQSLRQVDAALDDSGLWKLHCSGYFAIEGVIGAGKTTLAIKLAESLGGSNLFEGYAENPFLADYYRDSQRWALPTQLHFLAQRVEQLKELDFDRLTGAPKVADFSLVKDQLFAELSLSPSELALYRQISAQLIHSLPQPDCLIYLEASTPELLSRIKRRNRPYEQSITAAYLERLSKAYETLWQTQDTPRILRVNTDSLDLIDNPSDYEKFLQYILTEDRSRSTFSLQPA